MGIDAIVTTVTIEVEPCRARPVCFWRQGFLPPPDTSERFLTAWVPERSEASFALTTS